MNPAVSVIIPTYNSQKYISTALKSVFDQTYGNLEVILVDDASTDYTVKIATIFPDKRLTIIRNNRNRGVSYGRNRGIEQAKGKWIALLDSDDWYAPKRIEKLLEIAEKHNADLVADDLLLIRDGEQEPWSTLLSESPQDLMCPNAFIDAVKFVTSDRLPPINAKRNWSLGYTKPIIRREFLLKNNIRYDEKINVGEDFALYLESLRQKARFYLISQSYYYYRTRASSLSTRKPTEFLTQSCKITQSFIHRELHSQADSKLLQALWQNLIIFQKRLTYHRLLETVKEKKFWQVIRQIIANPYVLKDLFKKFIVVLTEKLFIFANPSKIAK
ncbi:MAG: glycosyltransferase family 2 protein [Pleurocapsa sp.]